MHARSLDSYPIGLDQARLMLLRDVALFAQARRYGGCMPRRLAVGYQPEVMRDLEAYELVAWVSILPEHCSCPNSAQREGLVLTRRGLGALRAARLWR